MRRTHLATALLLSAACGDALQCAPIGSHAARLPSPSQLRVATSPVLTEYSTKVKMTAETRAPLRQARLFFLYPATIAGASIAAYVSFLRVLSGQGEGLSDAGNLAVNRLPAVMSELTWSARVEV